MSKLDLELTEIPVWKKKWFPWVLVAGLIVMAVLLGRMALSARDRQKQLELELQIQQETIQTLRDDAAKQKEEEADRFVHEAEPVITSSLVNSQLRSLEELVTTEYMYTNSGKYDNRNQATIIRWDVDIPFTGKSFIVAYDGSIKAGVDLSKAQIQVDEGSRTITVTLPGSEIISHETFEDSLVVLDEKNNVFNPISISDYNDFVNEQKSTMEKKAIERGLLTSASAEAERIARSLLALLPGIDTYTLIVK